MWVEKYRPEKLDEVIDHEEVIARLKQFLKDPVTMPHLLFAGPPGNGKTTVALCIARQLFGNRLREYTLELNASDERGIGTVRDRIKNFSRMGTVKDVPFRLVILDECDELTADAQTALRRIMEMSSKTCRFILICNYSSKIIEPIQSRCVVFRFPDLRKDDVVACLGLIAQQEGVKLTKDGIDAIWNYCGGDLRRAINMLQASVSVSGVVSKDEVDEVARKAEPSQIREMLHQALTGHFMEAREVLNDLLFHRAFAGTDILRQLHHEILNSNLAEKEKARAIELIGEYDFRLTEGANEDIQLSALLARLATLKKSN
jgi:replication factor C small subunit